MKFQTKYIGIITLICLLCLAFTTGDNKSQYSIPTAAFSVTAGDIDLDGDNDIVVGHRYNSLTDWTGITIMQNDGFGYFTKDTFYLSGHHYDVKLEILDSNLTFDVII